MDQYGSRALTEKEEIVISLVAQGLRNIDIGNQIRSTENGVKNRLRVIYDKVGMFNRTELALWWLKREFERGNVKCDDCG